MPHVKKLVLQGFKSFANKTEIPFDKGINVILGPNGSGKCVTGESLVTLGNGTLERIDNLIDSKINNALKTEDGFLISGDGTEVISLNLKTKKVEKTRIKSFVKRTSPEKLLSIKTRSGREIKTTKYHPLFVLKNNEIVETRADKLKKGVRIAVPRKINFEPEHKYFIEVLNLITEEERIYTSYKEEYSLILRSIKNTLTWKQLAEKIGVSYYVIKGLLDKQSINLFCLIKILRYANLSDLEIIKLVDELVSNGKKTKLNLINSGEFSRFFGYLLAEGRLATSSQIWFTNGDKEIINDYISLVKKLFGKEPLIREYKPHCWDVILFSEPLKKILAKLGMASETGNKFISNILFKHSSNEEISNLLNGLYCGDGYISNNSIEITTKSSKLAMSIGHCLTRLGIIFSIRRRTKTIKSLNFSGEYYYLSIYGVHNFKKFNEHIKLIHNTKREMLLNNLNKTSNPNLDLIEVNSLVKELAKENNLNIKQLRREFPILDAYCYNQCTPSRRGLKLLQKSLFKLETERWQCLSSLVNSDVYWDAIEEVKELPGENWVYDLCVGEYHNFIANNIFVHNSNISDALCFVLGRLSIKSMRAAKAANLIFLGSKEKKPSKEAFVELVFDNSDKAFNIAHNEVKIKRAVKRNGQSAYSINSEPKTRQEILELLAQAGVDPHGFNIVLQGEIDGFVKMKPLERRKVIEEIAGISVYEIRKEKSLRELEKTDDRLKEISAILRERTAYLRNLEKERQQALRFKQLQETVRRCKASILNKDVEERTKQLDKVIGDIDKKVKEKDKIKITIGKLDEEINSLERQIEEINKHIQKSTGIEQESLNEEISNLRAEIAGLDVRKENLQTKVEEIEKRKTELEKDIPSIEKEIQELKKKSPMIAKKQAELQKKRQAFTRLEDSRREFYNIKSTLASLKDKLKDKNKTLNTLKEKSRVMLKEIEDDSITLPDKDYTSCLNKSNKLKKQIIELTKEKESQNKSLLSFEKEISVYESEISKNESLKKEIPKADICPLCKNKITEDHRTHVINEANQKNSELNKKLKELQDNLKTLDNNQKEISAKISYLTKQQSEKESNLMQIKFIDGKKNSLKTLVEEERDLQSEITELERKIKETNVTLSTFSDIDEKYEKAMFELEEISSISEKNINTTIMYKEQELERMKRIIKESARDIIELSSDTEETTKDIEEKQSLLDKREDEASELAEKFNNLFKKRAALQENIKKYSTSILDERVNLSKVEEVLNNFKIEKARIGAEKESLEIELKEFGEVKVISASKQILIEKRSSSQRILDSIGSVNLKALEVYDNIKKDYDEIANKTKTIEMEREEILKIIWEIDIKKRRTFIRTLKSINSLFTENSVQLYSKGRAFLELQDKQNIFDGGLDIIIKIGKGKYVDVTSLSGGEQTLIALSLIFAIQEHKPYPFYILDEIDAALDKRNSERLAMLFKKYIQKGQYINITHNDAIISEATYLYGVSMHSGVSKVISLEV